MHVVVDAQEESYKVIVAGSSRSSFVFTIDATSILVHMVVYSKEKHNKVIIAGSSS
jgi:hypothetical protein